MSEITTNKLAEDFKVLIDDVEELMKATANQAGERIGDLRQRLEKKIDEGRTALAERRRTWFHKADESGTSGECCAIAGPWIPVAIAIGVGVVLGLLLRRD